MQSTFPLQVQRALPEQPFSPWETRWRVFSIFFYLYIRSGTHTEVKGCEGVWLWENQNWSCSKLKFDQTKDLGSSEQVSWQIAQHIKFSNTPCLPTLVLCMGSYFVPKLLWSCVTKSYGPQVGNVGVLGVRVWVLTFGYGSFFNDLMVFFVQKKTF